MDECVQFRPVTSWSPVPWVKSSSAKTSWPGVKEEFASSRERWTLYTTEKPANTRAKFRGFVELAKREDKERHTTTTRVSKQRPAVHGRLENEIAPQMARRQILPRPAHRRPH